MADLILFADEARVDVRECVFHDLRGKNHKKFSGIELEGRDGGVFVPKEDIPRLIQWLTKLETSND